MAERSALHALFGDIECRDSADFSDLDPGFHPDNLDADLMVLPANTTEVREVLRTCNDCRVSVVTQGGRTGLSGAAVSQSGQIILDTRRMNRILQIDALSATAVVECGVTLEQLEKEANRYGLSCGIDLAARGTATIGGMVATNAGGIEAFRNGIMRNRIFGLESVLANGDVFSDLKQVSKANEGYDLKQLFVGAEGTLGVVTQVAISLVPRVEEAASVLVSSDTCDQAVALFRTLRKHPSLNLVSAEIMWPEYARLVAKETGCSNVLSFEDSDDVVFVLIEISLADQSTSEAIEAFLFEQLESGLIRNAVQAKNRSERNAMWQIREDSFVVDRAYPNGMWFDMSVPLAHMTEYSTMLRSKIPRLADGLQCFLFAHLGDGNFHATISSGNELSGLEDKIKSVVYDQLDGLGGSFSAEHGIGIDKIDALHRYVPDINLQMMHQIKSLFDPNGILNPGKVLKRQSKMP
ncbi:MAG: FAD-binding oxidoreductase [Pseudomonadota bacterium]